MKTILVADDDEFIRTTLALILSRDNYAVLPACDGSEAVRFAREHHPDLILLDLMMPVMDGWGALKQLKASSETARIPTFAITGFVTARDKAIDAGFDDFVEKPFSLRDLLQRIALAIAAAGETSD